MARRPAILLLTVSALTLALSGCTRIPPIREYPRFTEMPFDDGVAYVPIIVVGRIQKVTWVGKPDPSSWGNQSPMQLEEVAVQVENVLQGDVSPGENKIYYYANLLASGPARLGILGRGGEWQIGDREMFFAQRDAGYIRTICDTWHGCVQRVRTGAHPGFKPDPNNPIESIADILLTRGKNCTDQAMIQAIWKSPVDLFSKEIAIQHLQTLATTERLPCVRPPANNSQT